ncbi:MAG TPA: hypothetical protein VK841_10695 [Polyangiaceae bacterium]|nr:hypothetical protein [Polyangiaceae bacterium]
MADTRLSARIATTAVSFGLLGPCCAGMLGCSPPAAIPGASPESAPRDVAPGGGDALDGNAPMPRFHSKRFALSLGFPLGSEWRIDDHSTPALVATHAPTHSRVLVAVFFADAVVGRDQCKAAAEERKLVPSGPFQTLDDQTQVTQQTFDTRIEVVIASGSDPNQPLVGHVMAFGGFLRKCFVFDYSTEVPNAEGAERLSSRLAFAQTRIFGGLALDAMASPPRDQPDVPMHGAAARPTRDAPSRNEP